jgi:hypothetical protein
MNTRTSRKNPFGDATAYSGPQQQDDNNFHSDVAEDPSFQDVSNSHSGWNQPAPVNRVRTNNPYGSTQSGFTPQEDYSDLNAPNVKPSYNSQPAFNNSGWTTGAQTPQAPQDFNRYNQEQPNGFQKPSYPNSDAYGDSQMFNQSEEPPLLEGQFTIIFHLKNHQFLKILQFSYFCA